MTVDSEGIWRVDVAPSWSSIVRITRSFMEPRPGHEELAESYWAELDRLARMLDSQHEVIIEPRTAGEIQMSSA